MALTVAPSRSSDISAASSLLIYPSSVPILKPDLSDQFTYITLQGRLQEAQRRSILGTRIREEQAANAMDPAFDFYFAGTLEELPDIPRRPIALECGLPGVLSEVSPHKAGLRASLPANTLTIDLSPSAPFGPTAAQLIERLLPDGPEDPRCLDAVAAGILPDW